MSAETWDEFAVKLRALLAEVYTAEGVEIAMRSRLRLQGLKITPTPYELWKHGHGDAVLKWAYGLGEMIAT